MLMWGQPPSAVRASEGGSVPNRLSLCTLPIAIYVACIQVCESLRQWKRKLQIMYGAFQSC